MKLNVLFKVSVLGFFTITDAHFANMDLDGVSCYILDGIEGTTPGDAIAINSTHWHDHDDPSKKGSVTVVTSQEEYLDLPTHPKIGIVCSPDEIDLSSIYIPYAEMEPTDEEFYQNNATVYQANEDPQSRFRFKCVIEFCRGSD
ncbi:unnamed protein product [Candida verbasci]|uniref:Uncharacterized protein n=1 Tax=Candida verbasci TaxID=1227364 RepID=A0A9W4TXB6_9ASCO|nr:unnamed protein product [Candida verbasci]